jgi:hypothetical protein
MKNLKQLILFNNQLSGSIPSSLGNLTSLEYVDLFSNQLSGNISSSLGKLLSLVAINLSYNQLSGSIPSSLGNPQSLSDLNLSYNQLSGAIPSSLGNLTLLGSFNLSHNQLSSHIPPSLGNLTGSLLLDLSHNQLEGNIPSSLGNCVRLYYLRLNNNKLSGTIPSTLSNLVNVFDLELNNNHFTFDGIEFVAKKFPFAIYTPQADISIHQQDNVLSVSAGGTLRNNTYKWFECGQTKSIIIKGDSVFHPSQSGTYFAKVSNTIAIQLILKSDTIKYMAPAELNEPAFGSSENVLRQQDKMNQFLVYPNPAKNILHVQTKGSAVLILTNQLGKILVIKNVNNNSEINVSNLSSGMYYLKNNATGAVQKVIVSK